MGGTTTAHKLSQDPNANLDYRADFRSHCVRVREPGLTYANNVRIEPMVATGFQYSATPGRTGTTEPRWPLTAGQTVKDGSVTWTAQVIDGNALQRTLSTAVWTGEGLTIGTPANDTTSSTAFISGGVEGQTYEVICEGTFSDGSVEVRAFTLTIER